MFKLVLRPKSDSERSYPLDVTIFKNSNGDLEIDLCGREIVLEESDIEKLRKLLFSYALTNKSSTKELEKPLAIPFTVQVNMLMLNL